MTPKRAESTENSHHPARRAAGAWCAVNTWVAVVVVGIFLAVTIYKSMPVLTLRERLNKEVEQLRREVAARKMRVAYLKTELAKVNLASGDEEYICLLARDRIPKGLVGQGEFVIQIPADFGKKR